MSLKANDASSDVHASVPRCAVAVGEDEGRSDIAGVCFGCHSLIVDPASQ